MASENVTDEIQKAFAALGQLPARLQAILSVALHRATEDPVTVEAMKGESLVEHLLDVGLVLNTIAVLIDGKDLAEGQRPDIMNTLTDRPANCRLLVLLLQAALQDSRFVEHILRGSTTTIQVPTSNENRG